MKNSKVYFITSLSVNALLLLSIVTVFYNFFGISASGIEFVTGFGFFVTLVILALLPTIVIIFYWGLVLIFSDKIRDMFVIAGVIICLVFYSFAISFIKVRVNGTGCWYGAHELCEGGEERVR